MKLCLYYFTEMEFLMVWLWMDPRHKLKGNSEENCVMQAAISSRLNPTHNTPIWVKELCVNLKRAQRDKCYAMAVPNAFGMTA
jgi:hypothetical protein